MKKTLLATTYTYPKPINFDPTNFEFDIFKKITSEQCPEAKIEFLKNVRIANNSVVFKCFKIFRNSCYNEENYNLHSKGYKFFIKYFFPKLNFSKKRFILLTDEWTSNYYHWHTFALKKLLILQEKNLIDKNSIIFLTTRYKRSKFYLESLAKFGISKNQIFFLRRNSNIKVAELPLIEAPRQHPEIYKKIRQTLINNTKVSDLGFGDKIYLSREKQILRFVENADEVHALLEKWGFKKVITEDLSYDEQISIFFNAKYFVAPHGAGLTNALFMKEGANVLEMATPIGTIHDRAFNRDFYALSTMIGLNYFYQECTAGQKSSEGRMDFHHASLVVDLEKLEKNLHLMFKHDSNNNPERSLHS
jgi:hypothetical protein